MDQELKNYIDLWEKSSINQNDDKLNQFATDKEIAFYFKFEDTVYAATEDARLIFATFLISFFLSQFRYRLRSEHLFSNAHVFKIAVCLILQLKFLLLLLLLLLLPLPL